MRTSIIVESTKQHDLTFRNLFSIFFPKFEDTENLSSVELFEFARSFPFNIQGEYLSS